MVESLVKTRGLLALLLSCLVSSAGAGDLLLMCSTKGADTYQDGASVAEGECYALVHTVRGATFQGFTADGKALDPAKSYVALVAPLAEGGRCPPTLFQVLEENAVGREDGHWELFLVDTRCADGRPSGTDGRGGLRRVNAWRRVAGDVRAKRGSLTGEGGFSRQQVDMSAERLDGGEGVLPAAVPQPRITGIRVRADGAVELSVANTVPYLTYDVAGAVTPSDFGRCARRVAREARDGIAGADIRLEVDEREISGKEESVRFFKIVRR